MSRRLILLRHGETEFNLEGRMQGQLNVPLTDKGLAQAELVAPVIADYQPFAIHSSDSDRALTTADAVAAACGLSVVKDQRLRETGMGEWAGLNRDQVEATWPGQRLPWRSDPLFAPPGGESRLEVAERATAVLREALTTYPSWGEDDRPLVIVSHGGTILALAAVLTNQPLFNYSMFSAIGNTSWSLFTEWTHAYDVDQLAAHPAAGGPSHPAVEPLTPGAIWRVDIWNSSQHLGGDAF